MLPVILGVGALVGVGALIWYARRDSSVISEASVSVEKKPIAPTSDPESKYWLPRHSSGAAPKSVRNKNPGNLRFIRTNPFNGQTGDDGQGYGVYSSLLLGTRAAFLNLRNYFTRDGLDTVREIITKWAPHSENPTTAYIDFVCGQLGVGPDQALRYDVHSRSLIKAIARFEAGYQPWTDQLYADAYKAAA